MQIPIIYPSLPVENRAFILYGVAYPNPLQPWSKEKSPFGNDMQVYYKHWDNEVKRIISETNGKDRIAADIFCFRHRGPNKVK